MTPILLSGLALIVIARILLPRRPSRSGPGEIRGALRLLWTLNRAYCATMHRLVLLNTAPLPDTGPAILIANHTSGIDNFVLQAGCDRVLGFMIAREFHENWLIRPFSRMLRSIPVNRDGRDISATREALRALDSGRVLPIFPEGRITPASGREFGPGKPGAAFLTLRARVPVIPAYVRGTPPTNNVWRALITPSRVRVIFGPPLDLSPYFDAVGDHARERAVIAELTDRLMDAIRSLRDQSLALEPAG